MKKRPAIPSLDGGPQTILLVEDVARTAEFYQENLRLEWKDGDGDRYAEFATGDGGRLLIVNQEGSIAPMAGVLAAAAPATLTFSITAEAFGSWKKWLTKRGVEIAQETKWIHGGRSLYVLDPDGRRIEFKAPADPRFAADDKAAAAAGQSAADTATTAAPPPAKTVEAAPAPAKPAEPAAAAAKPAEPPATRKEKADTKSSGGHGAEKEADAKRADAKSTAVPPVHGVVETCLYTDNLARATAFYRDVLGLSPMTGDGERFQAFDSGAGRVLLLFKRGATLEPVPAPVGMIPPHDGYGPLHLALAIDAADYDSWCARLRSHKVAIESETHWDRGGRSVYFRDPDKHLIELVTPGIWPNY
jgi:catechol 2,3-dioxygenase-like lactoylglutathione lyase family enzyme